MTVPHSLVLASSSPQRRAILEQLRVRFTQVAPTYEEEWDMVDPTALAQAHALGKAQSVHRASQLTLGVDTIVATDSAIYGKPRDAPTARTTLAALSGRTHRVISGLCLLGAGDPVVQHAITAVTFRAVPATELDAYLATGEWEGRAGGYAIQGRGARFVARIEGDYLNVVGVPGASLIELLASRCPEVLDLP